MKDVKIEFRKPIYPIVNSLEEYLEKNNKTTQIKVVPNVFVYKIL